MSDDSNVVVEGTLAWAEEHYRNGSADEVSGDVEAPTGHFYRVDRWIVITNSQGFTEITEFATEDEAREEFEQRDDDYAEWDEN